ncbi:protease inhibitor I9 family protein [Kribbella sp. NBC_00359]|uniref:protease inhibitor I9 family protein n=1 Tax=Kribbella sp. NBC_00359 TaxID=2975966 RepID=UPI002E215C23
MLKNNAAVRSRGVAAIAHGLAGSHRGTVSHVWTDMAQGFSVTMSAAEASKLAADPNVASVHQDQYYSMADSTGVTGEDGAPPSGPAPRLTQTDPHSWGLDRVDQRKLPLDHRYHDDAHQEGQDVTVYLVSTGVRETHQDLGNRAVLVRDFVNDNHAQDCRVQGTAGAGAIGGNTNGVAKKADIVVLRAFDCDLIARASDLAAAVDWVANNNIGPAVLDFNIGPVCRDLDDLHVIPCDPDEFKLIRDALTLAMSKGIQVVQPVGDLGQAAGVDACTAVTSSTPGVLIVGGTSLSSAGTTDQAWSLSNFGSCVGIWAPAAGVVVDSSASDTAEVSMSTTLIATGLVSGALALILSDPKFAHATPRDLTVELLRRATLGVITGMHSGDNNRLLYTRPPGSFTVGSVLKSTPGADGLQNLFAVNAAGKMVERFQTGTAVAVAGAGGRVAGPKGARVSGLAAASSWGPWITSTSGGWASVGSERNANGKLQLVGVTASKQLWQRQQLAVNSNTWTAWSQLDSPSSLGITAVSLKGLADGRVVMFGSNADGGSFFQVQTAANATTWSGWSALPFTGTARSITAESNADGKVEVFASDTDGAVWRTKQVSADSMTWTTPAVIPGAPPVYMVAASRHKDGRVDLFTIGDGNLMAHTTQTSAGASTYTTSNQPIANAALTSVSASVNNDQIDVIGVDSSGAVLESLENAADANSWPAFTQIGTAGTVLPQPVSD